jgi:iron uptake system EfeUOB component EfeO/EfeM
MKIDMLRALYQERGNSTALQQLDVYDGRSEYIMKFEQLTQAVTSGDIEKRNTLLEWYRANYPDIK